MMPYCGYYHRILSIFGRDFVYHCRRVADHVEVINFNQIAYCNRHERWGISEIALHKEAE